MYVLSDILLPQLTRGQRSHDQPVVWTGETGTAGVGGAPVRVCLEFGWSLKQEVRWPLEWKITFSHGALKSK